MELHYVDTDQYAAVDLEEAVLGALMLEKGALFEILDILKTPGVFSDEKRRIVYKAVLELHNEGNPIDILTVSNKLRKQDRLDDIGGAFYISTLTNRVSSAANIQYHARIICQFYIQREYIRYAERLHEHAQDNKIDAVGLLDYNQAFQNEISSFFHAGQSVKMENVSKEFFKTLERQMKRNTELAGYSTGFSDLDNILLGLQNGSLIIVAARPGEGKTVLACNIATHVADYEKMPVGIFSLETPATQLMGRMISADLEIPHRKIQKGFLSPYELENLHKSKIHNLPIHIYDNSNLTINELRAHAIRLFHEEGVRLIIVDYLQLMGGKRRSGGTREEEVSSISRGLKILARELNIPVIAVAQLSREAVRRGAGPPLLSDLRESGALEQDADTVIFINRPEIHGYEVDQEGNSTKGKAVVVVAKHRHGSTGELPLEFKGQYYKFSQAA